MRADTRHRAWLKFVRDVLEVPLRLSKNDLQDFRNIANLEQPALVPIIKAYMTLAEHSDSRVDFMRLSPKKKRSKSSELHLFDLLRERAFFPQNSDLAQFASRVLPQLQITRFEKLSRTNIAARIIEHLESLDPDMRRNLEESMREALDAMRGKEAGDNQRKSFLNKWEMIIKGVARTNE